MAFRPKLDLGFKGLWIGERLKNLCHCGIELRLAFRSGCRFVYCWNRRVLHRLARD